MENVNIQVIARMRSDFPTKFGIPRQSGLVEELRSTIVFEPEFRNADALRGRPGLALIVGIGYVYGVCRTVLSSVYSHSAEDPA
jgi:tRNA (Thr-GGU) A37 N-methylase